MFIIPARMVEATRIVAESTRKSELGWSMPANAAPCTTTNTLTKKVTIAREIMSAKVTTLLTRPPECSIYWTYIFTK